MLEKFWFRLWMRMGIIRWISSKLVIFGTFLKAVHILFKVRKFGAFPNVILMLTLFDRSG